MPSKYTIILELTASYLQTKPPCSVNPRPYSDGEVGTKPRSSEFAYWPLLPCIVRSLGKYLLGSHHKPGTSAGPLRLSSISNVPC
jgi:hypothetical protein